MVRWGTNLEQTLAAAVKLHAEADAAGLTGAGELTEQSGQDGAGQCLLQQRVVGSHRSKVIQRVTLRSNWNIGQDPKKEHECASCGLPSKCLNTCQTGKTNKIMYSEKSESAA